MVTHTRNWSSAFNPSKCTHTAVSSEHTHCEHAPGAVGSHCSSARGAIGGLVPCSRAPQSWYWRWRECCSFTIPTFNPCRTWDSNPQPLDYKSDSLTITVCSHRRRRERQSGRKSFIFNESRRRGPARASRRVLDDESVEESWNQVNFMVMSYDAVRRQPIGM